ncbi:MAG: hypothetical protein MK052_09150, partial [Alphaproteobacteria bacterium]|nr:hypothetical protein [Alphaproteobacteria bacterium]
KIVRSEQKLYIFRNFNCQLLVIVSLLWAWNLSAFVLEVIWAGLSLYKLWQIYRAKRQPVQ